MTTDEQLERVLDCLRAVLRRELVGAYLHGSAALGGLRPHSDLDVFVVSRRRTTLEEKRRLIGHLLAVSRAPRPIDLTIVVESEIRPWTYPPVFDFQYGDWLRERFERGELEPWPSTTNPDLASLVTMVLLGNRPLLGPPPAEIFDRIPPADYDRALTGCVDGLLGDLSSDTRNVLLTLARIWSSLTRGGVVTKDAAADWAIPLLPEECRPPLARARDIYLGEERERWTDILPQVHLCVDRIVTEIRRIAPAI